MTDTIAQRIAQIQNQLPAPIRLIAISKTVSVEHIRQAYAAGIRDFGENRLQEALNKQTQLQDLTDICWHFIGHLQGNKAKKAIAHFHWIHAIDSLDLAHKLNNLIAEGNPSPNLLLQIKPLRDRDKYGWEIPQFWQDLPHLGQFQHLKIQGLMTILPFGLDAERSQQAFQTVQTLQTEINQKQHFPQTLQELSMGMSGDYPEAIAAGATMIRIGQGIFGPRTTEAPDKT